MRFSALMKYFRDEKEAYLAKRKELNEVLGIKTAEKFINFRNQFDPVKKLEELKEKEITVIPLNQTIYPLQLKNISDPPICLYIKGNIKQIDWKSFFFAVVGTRKPTPYGEQVTRKFATELSEAGFVIVSGLAIGIDSAAHWAAINSSGKTVAFLGCGVDVIYPSSNFKLYQRIIERGGLIISEFPPGHTVLPGLFIARNRLISGLSMGVLVVEGAKDSGALITAKYALEQGKEVFAPPGPLTSEMSVAPNFLLKQGAKLVTCLEDILEEFDLKIAPKKKEDFEKDLNSEEKRIFEILSKEAKLADEIAIDMGLSIEKILNILSVLEIKGIIEKNSEGKYQVRY